MNYFTKGMMAGDANVGLDEVQIFEKAFGGVVHDGEVYLDPMRGVDKRSKVAAKVVEAMKKAVSSIDLTTGGNAAATGTVLIPVWTEPTPVDQTKYETPLRNLFARVACRGKNYNFVRITAKGGASWKAENAPLPEDVDTYASSSVAIKFGYSVGKLTYPAIAAMRGFIDAQSLDLGLKTQALYELEEDTIVNGDASTYGTEFTGLISGITTNATNLSGAAVSLAAIRNEFSVIFQSKGRCNLVVTDTYTHDYVKGLLMDFQRQPASPAEGLPFGIPGAFSLDGVNFIKSQFMPTTSGSRRMLFLDTRWIVMPVLQDVTFQEVPSLNDSTKYMLKVYESLAITFEPAQSQIYGIL